MAIPAPASNYSTPTISRAGTLITELNIVTPRPYNKFFKKYNYTPYMLLTQLSPNGMIAIKPPDEKADNKLFYWYEEFGRLLGFFTASAAVAATGAGAAITVTVGSTGYSAGGTRSLPEIGAIFFNARTGVESRVTAVNKTTVNAHTVTLQPVRAADNASVNAGDELQWRGFKYVGEASDYTGTQVQNISKYVNYCSQLRKDSKETDLSMAERIDFEWNGQPFYTYKQMDDMNNMLIQEQELMLLDSVLTDNLGYLESGTIGLIQQIRANGQNIASAGTSPNVQTEFSKIDRIMDAEGASMEFDFLQDTTQFQAFQLGIANEFPNGAIVYDQNDLRRGFKSFMPMGRRYNFVPYKPISEQSMYGSSANGTVRNNFGIGIPRNSTAINGDVKVNDAPQMLIRYQEILKGQRWVVGETGALSTNGKTNKMEKNVFQETHIGLQVNGANQFFIYS